MIIVGASNQTKGKAKNHHHHVITDRQTFYVAIFLSLLINQATYVYFDIAIINSEEEETS